MHANGRDIALHFPGSLWLSSTVPGGSCQLSVISLIAVAGGWLAADLMKVDNQMG